VLETSKFSELTDVWSYGITAIEIFTQGSTPYAGWTHSLVIDRLRGGYRLPRPDTCPVELFDMVIAPCWLPTDGDPGRPTFDALLGRLTEVAGVIKVGTQGVMWDSLDLDGTQHHDRPDSSEPTALGDELHASISNPNSLRYEYVSPMDGAVHGSTGLYPATGADQHGVPHPRSAPASDVASEDLDLRASTDSGLQTDCTRLPELAVAGSEQRVEVSFYSVGQVSQNSTADPRPRTPPDTLRATLL
jgi:serine/threonine protein kinase